MNVTGYVAMALAMAWATSGENGQVMSPAEVDSLTAREHHLLLLDVRTEEEFQGALGHLEGALLIPVQELSDRMQELEPYRSDTIVVYCRTGSRSHYATELLRAKGFKAFNMTGGMVQWNNEHRPVIRAEHQ